MVKTFYFGAHHGLWKDLNQRISFYFISLLGNYEYLLSQDDTVDEYDYHNNDILISKEVPQNKR